MVPIVHQQGDFPFFPVGKSHPHKNSSCTELTRNARLRAAGVALTSVYAIWLSFGVARKENALDMQRQSPMRM